MFQIKYFNHLHVSPVVVSFEKECLEYQKVVDDFQLASYEAIKNFSSIEQLLNNLRPFDSRIANIIGTGTETDPLGIIAKPGGLLHASMNEYRDVLKKHTALVTHIMMLLRDNVEKMSALDIMRRQLIQGNAQSSVSLIDVMYGVFNNPMYKDCVHTIMMNFARYNSLIDDLCYVDQKIVQLMKSLRDILHAVIDMYHANDKSATILVEPGQNKSIIRAVEKYMSFIDKAIEHIASMGDEICLRRYERIMKEESKYRQFFSIDPNLYNKHIGDGSFREMAQQYLNARKAIDLTLAQLKREQKNLLTFHTPGGINVDLTVNAPSAVLSRTESGAKLQKMLRMSAMMANNVHEVAKCFNYAMSETEKCVNSLMGVKEKSIPMSLQYMTFLRYMYKNVYDVQHYNDLAKKLSLQFKDLMREAKEHSMDAIAQSLKSVPAGEEKKAIDAVLADIQRKKREFDVFIGEYLKRIEGVPEMKQVRDAISTIMDDFDAKKDSVLKHLETVLEDSTEAMKKALREKSAELAKIPSHRKSLEVASASGGARNRKKSQRGGHTPEGYPEPHEYYNMKIAYLNDLEKYELDDVLAMADNADQRSLIRASIEERYRIHREQAKEARDNKTSPSKEEKDMYEKVERARAERDVAVNVANVIAQYQWNQFLLYKPTLDTIRHIMMRLTDAYTLAENRRKDFENFVKNRMDKKENQELHHWINMPAIIKQIQRDAKVEAEKNYRIELSKILGTSSYTQDFRVKANQHRDRISSTRKEVKLVNYSDWISGMVGIINELGVKRTEAKDTEYIKQNIERLDKDIADWTSKIATLRNVKEEKTLIEMTKPSIASTKISGTTPKDIIASRNDILANLNAEARKVEQAMKNNVLVQSMQLNILKTELYNNFK